MKKKAFVLFLLAISFLNGFSQIGGLSQLKSCKIEFVYGTPSFKGTKTLIFSDSGKIEKVINIQFVDTSTIQPFLSGELLQKKEAIRRTTYHSMQIQTLDSVFTVDLDSMIGMGQPRMPIFAQLSSLDRSWKKVGEDTLLNRKCEIMDLYGMKIWYWKGIALKKQFPIHPDECTNCLYEYATSIDENYIIKEDEFKVPSIVKIK